MSKLPEGWVDARIGDVISLYESTDPRKRPRTEFTYIDIGSIDNTSQTITEPKSFFGSEAPSRARRVVAVGDILFSTVRTYLKNIAMVPLELDGKLTSTGIAILRSNGAVDPRYLFNWVRSNEFVDEISASQDGSVYPAVRERDIRSASIPVPPLAEQRKIAAKVDGLNTRITRARNELDRIPFLIARYKGAVLASAFKGDLTRDWRENDGVGEGNESDLPSKWEIKTLAEISDIQGGIQVGKKRPSSAALVEVPYLRVANVQRGWLDLDEIKTLRVTPKERDRLLLRNGDVLMNEGGDRDKLGRGWVWHEEVPDCIHQNHVFRIRLTDKDFPPEFISHYANENGQQYFIDQGKQTTNLASISKKKVSALPVPIPPTDEAIEIVRRIETVFSWLDRVAADHSAADRMLPTLEAAILAQAFKGKLVPQDPDDEPANLLLDRINDKNTVKPGKSRKRTPDRIRTPKELKTMAKTLEEALAEAGDWISAQEAFERCGMGTSASTEEIEALYAQLRRLDYDGKLETEAVNDDQGRKVYDRLRLKAA